MRRVSIGLELISGPDVLLLDEPTSGLDSVSAARVANVLHAIAHDPVNPTPVIASVHQPRYAPLLAHQLSCCILLIRIPALNYIKSLTLLSFCLMVARFIQVQAPLPLQNTSQLFLPGPFHHINKATMSQSTSSKWPAIHLSVYSKCTNHAPPLSVKEMVLTLGCMRENHLKKISTDPLTMKTLTRRPHRCCAAHPHKRRRSPNLVMKQHF